MTIYKSHTPTMLETLDEWQKEFSEHGTLHKHEIGALLRRAYEGEHLHQGLRKLSDDILEKDIPTDVLYETIRTLLYGEDP